MYSRIFRELLAIRTGSSSCRRGNNKCRDLRLMGSVLVWPRNAGTEESISSEKNVMRIIAAALLLLHRSCASGRLEGIRGRFLLRDPRSMCPRSGVSALVTWPPRSVRGDESREIAVPLNESQQVYISQTASGSSSRTERALTSTSMFLSSETLLVGAT